MLKKLIAVVAVVGTVMSAWALTAKEEMIVNRIMHSATVCVAGDACSGQDAPAATTVAAAARAGDQVYNTGCAACHASGAAGAPRQVTQALGPIVRHRVSTPWLSMLMKVTKVCRLRACVQTAAKTKFAVQLIT